MTHFPKFDFESFPFPRQSSQPSNGSRRYSPQSTKSYHLLPRSMTSFAPTPSSCLQSQVIMNRFNYKFQLLYELVFLRTINLSNFSSLNQKSYAKITEIEQTLANSISDLLELCKKEEIKKEDMEKYILSPFLNLVCCKTKNGEFKNRLEKVCRRFCLNISFWASEPLELKMSSVNNPKPQNLNMFASSQKPIGLFKRNQGKLSEWRF